jgi:uncharacterized protein YoxC
MEDAVTRPEYEEYKQRIEEEDVRQNRRIELLEEQTKQINNLTISVEKLAQSVKAMAESQEAYSKRLETLEGRDGEKWRTVVTHVITLLVGALISYGLSHIGL